MLCYFIGKIKEEFFMRGQDGDKNQDDGDGVGMGTKLMGTGWGRGQLDGDGVGMEQIFVLVSLSTGYSQITINHLLGGILLRVRSVLVRMPDIPCVF